LPEGDNNDCSPNNHEYAARKTERGGANAPVDDGPHGKGAELSQFFTLMRYKGPQPAVGIRGVGKPLED
jgi:hypothetical protein